MTTILTVDKLQTFLAELENRFPKERPTSGRRASRGSATNANTLQITPLWMDCLAANTWPRHSATKDIIDFGGIMVKRFNSIAERSPIPCWVASMPKSYRKINVVYVFLKIDQGLEC